MLKTVLIVTYILVILGISGFARAESQVSTTVTEHVKF